MRKSIFCSIRGNAGNLFLIALIGIAILSPVGHSQSTITAEDAAILKTYADAFNQSRNYITPYGPAEYVCWTSGTFLSYKPCHDLPTCTQTANLVCSVSGGSCMVDILALHILAYKNGVDKLNAAYSSFMVGYGSFSASSIEGPLGQMDRAFDAMKIAADEVGLSKLRLPDKIPCPCNVTDCCLGRCPEAHFNYTAIAAGKSGISRILLKSCSDGTLGGQCSPQKPQECVLGQLVNNAAKCGCHSGMQAASGGTACEYIPCMDNGVSVPEATCSPKTSGKMCVNGQLVDKASSCPCKIGTAKQGEACIIVLCSDGTKHGECSDSKPKECVLTSENTGALVDNSARCGCPAGQYASGNSCLCPTRQAEVCNITNVTKYHYVTYVFDRDDKKIMNENYTFEKKSCYLANNTYTGAGCTVLANSTVNSTPIFESQDPWVPSTVKVPCSRCPAICNRSAPVGLKCGECTCPANLGFCDTASARVNLTGAPTSAGAPSSSGATPAYCADGLLMPQKDDNTACAQGFECKANECRGSKCYNRQHDIVQLFMDWVQGLFGFGK